MPEMQYYPPNDTWAILRAQQKPFPTALCITPACVRAQAGGTNAVACVRGKGQSDGEAEGLFDVELGDVEALARGLLEALSDVALGDVEAVAAGLVLGLPVAALGDTEAVAIGLPEGLPPCPGLEPKARR